MSAPEAVGFLPQSDHEGAFGILAGRSAIDDVLEPGFDTRFPIVIGDPGSREGESTLGVIDGANAVESPEEGWQGEGAEGGTFAPPEVPEQAGAGATFGFRWEEAGEAEQAGFPRIAAVAGIGGQRIENGQDFREALHGPGVVLVSERSEHALPQGLSPAGGTSTDSEHVGFGAKPDQRGLLQEVADPFRRERLHGGGAVAGDPGRLKFAIAVDPFLEFLDGGIQEFAEGESGEGRIGFGRVPGDVENHIGVRGILEMTMGPPAGRMDIDLDVAGLGVGIADLHDSTEEVGSRFAVPEAWVEDAHGLFAGGDELFAAEALMRPDLLKPAFRGGTLPKGLVELQLGFAGFTPPKIKPLGQRHLLNGH